MTRFTDPAWDLLLAVAGVAAMMLVRPWPMVLLIGAASLVLLRLRLSRADQAKAFGRGSKLNLVLTWVLGVNMLALTLLRASSR